MATLEQASFASAKAECLFGLLCNYNPNDPVVYFSLGSAIAGFGIIFAAYQLSKPSWEVVLNIKGWWARNIIWIFSITAVVLVIIASIISQIPLSNSNIFNYPIFYEILATFSFLLAPLLFIFNAGRKKNIFNKNKAEKFYDVLLQELGRSYPRKNEIITDILKENLTNIISAAKEYEKEPKMENKERQHNYFGEIAVDILNLIVGDEEIAKYIVINRYDFLFEFFDELERHKDFNKGRCMLGVNSIVKQLFFNKQSHLYKHMEGSAFSLVGNNIYYYLFYNQNIFSTFQPLKQWEGGQIYLDNSEFRYTLKYLEVYLFSFKKSIEGYFEEYKAKKAGSNFEVLRIFQQEFAALIDGYVGTLISDFNDRKVDREFLFERLRSILHFLTVDILDIYEKYSEFNSFEPEIETFKDNDFNAIYAYALVNFIKNLSVIKRSKENESEIFSLGNKMSLIGPIEENKKYEDIRQKFEKLAWIEIEDNVDRKFFPAFLRIYILLFIGRKDLEERENLVHCMYENLKPRFLNGERMLDDELMEEVLLPLRVQFDHEDEKFYFISRDGSKKEIK